LIRANLHYVLHLALQRGAIVALFHGCEKVNK
jgi:hypothetical protein